jgi:DNA end-binding protein Ku
MRSIWSGALSFGLVNIPVHLFSASQDRSLNFDMLHNKDLSPIRFARICKADGKEIPYQDIVKGYEYEKGEYVVITEEDFKNASPKKTSTIEIIQFANEDEIDPIYYEKPYYLEPDKGAKKPYSLLQHALKKSKKVGIVRYVFHHHEHIGVVKSYQDLILLIQLRFYDDIRTYDLHTPVEEVSSKELTMALKLIDQLTEPFKPESYKDTYVEELKALIQTKLKGKKTKHKKEVIELTQVQDIMSKLKASLNGHRPHPIHRTSSHLPRSNVRRSSGKRA